MDPAVDVAVVAVVLLGVVSAMLIPSTITNHTILQQTEKICGEGAGDARWKVIIGVFFRPQDRCLKLRMGVCVCRMLLLV